MDVDDGEVIGRVNPAMFTANVLAQWLETNVDFSTLLEQALNQSSVPEKERQRYLLGAQDGYERLLEMNLDYFRSLDLYRRRNEIAGALRW
jgi:hypothetical protein